jgi:hypothetical protein
MVADILGDLKVVFCSPDGLLSDVLLEEDVVDGRLTSFQVVLGSSESFFHGSRTS